MKQKVTYAEFVAAQKKGNLAWYIGKRLAEGRRMSDSPRYILEAIRKDPIGSLSAATLTVLDLVQHCRDRASGNITRARSISVKPQTIKQDFVLIRSTIQYFVDLEILPATALNSFRPAKRRLEEEQLIGDAPTRKRRPKAEEIAALRAYFAERNARWLAANEALKARGMKPKPVIDMVLMTDWQLASARRVGESCALLWEDWNRAESTILVRKIKAQAHARVAFVPPDAQAILERLWETRDPNEPRIFPYRKASVSAAYTQAKKALGIKNLRLHDSRGDRITRLVEQDKFNADEAALVSLHADIGTLRKRYLSLDPAKLKDGPAALRA